MTMTIGLIVLIGTLIITLVLMDVYKRSRTQSEPHSENSLSQQQDPLFDDIEQQQVLQVQHAVEDRQSAVRTIVVDEALETVPEERQASSAFANASAAVITGKKSKPPCEKSLVVVMNLMAREKDFDGPNVLQALLSMGFKHGEMSIFHRHAQASGAGPVLFSCASAVEPGIFDLDAMGSFSTPGLTLFLQVPGAKEALNAFDLMLETADKLAERLTAEVLDEKRQALTVEKIEQLRATISEITRQQEATTTLTQYDH